MSPLEKAQLIVEDKSELELMALMFAIHARAGGRLRNSSPTHVWQSVRGSRGQALLHWLNTGEFLDGKVFERY